MIRFGSKEDWVTIQVGAMLPEDVQAKGWRFSLLSEAREVFGSLLGKRAWAPMDWSEFGSEIRSESDLALEGRPAGFSMMVVDSESVCSLNLNNAEFLVYLLLC